MAYDPSQKNDYMLIRDKKPCTPFCENYVNGGVSNWHCYILYERGVQKAKTVNKKLNELLSSFDNWATTTDRISKICSVDLAIILHHLINLII